MRLNLWTILVALSATGVMGAPAPVANESNQPAALEKRYPPPKFTWEGNTPMRGVNLGGWLLLEPYMNTDLFPENSGMRDQWDYDTRARNDRGMRERLENNWRTFITPDDIEAISNAGLNTVRIPLGYWTILNTPVYNEPYIPGGLKELGDVLKKCAELGINVIISMHGLPGSQNGQDNSGRILDGQHGNWWNNEGNKGKSWDTAMRLVELFGNGKYGGIVSTIELANEPKPWNDWDVTYLQQYFRDCYEWIRKKDPNMHVLFSDGWKPLGANGPWNDFSKGMNKVAMDTHVYTLWDSKKYSFDENIAEFCKKKDGILAGNQQMPTIVGEWTISVGNDDCDNPDQNCPYSGKNDYMRRAFETQTWIYEQAKGWVFWNWKMSNPDDDWAFQKHLRTGVIPQPLDDRKYGTPCQ